EDGREQPHAAPRVAPERPRRRGAGEEEQRHRGGAEQDALREEVGGQEQQGARQEEEGRRIAEGVERERREARRGLRQGQGRVRRVFDVRHVVDVGGGG